MTWPQALGPDPEHDRQRSGQLPGDSERELRAEQPAGMGRSVEAARLDREAREREARARRKPKTRVRPDLRAGRERELRQAEFDLVAGADRLALREPVRAAQVMRPGIG